MDDLENGAGDQKSAAETSPVQLEDELGAIFDKVNEPEPTGGAGGGTTADAGKSAPVEGDQGAGTRDPVTGKFTKSAGAEKPAAETKPEAGAPIAGATATNSEQAKPEGSKLPPSSWSVDAKSQWASLPPAIQQAVLKREEEVSEGFRQKSEELKGYTGIGQILGPRAQALTANYGSTENAVNLWAQMNDYAVRDVKGFIKWYANARGVDLAELAGSPGQQPYQASAQNPADPQVAALAGEVKQISSYLQNQVAQQEQQTVAQITTEVERFRSDPKNLYFDNVRDDMAALIKNGLASTVQDAYEQAIWRNPEIRGKLLAAQSNAADEARKSEAQRKAADATRVNATNLSSAGTVAGSTPMSRDEELSAAFDRINAA